jgi:O-antigen ligase
MASTLAVDSIIYPSRTAALEDFAAPRSEALARTSLIAILLAAPLAFGAVQPWAWGALAVAAFSLFLIWSVAGARQGRLRIYWSPLYVPAALFFLLVTIQFAGHLTLDRMATRESLLKLATDLIFFFLGQQIFTAAPEKTARVLGPVLVVYAFLLALFAIFQFFSSQGLIYWIVKGPGWTFGPYVNHNHYAGLMEMLIPLSVAGVLPALRRNALALLLGFAVLIPIASLLLSGSRGGFISLVVEVALAAALVFFCGPRDARRATALLGGIALLAAGLLFFWMAPRHIAERLATMQDATHHPEVELGGRLVAARDALGILREHPWLGAGLGSFETAFPRHQSFPTDFRWDHAHNDYAEVLAETGLIGGVLILSAMGLFFGLALEKLSGQAPPGAPPRALRDGRQSGATISTRSTYMANGPHRGNVVSTRTAALGVLGKATICPPPPPIFSDFLSDAPAHASLSSRTGLNVALPAPLSAERPRSRPASWQLSSDAPRPTAYFLRLGAALACCGLLVHSFVDFNLHIPANAAWFAICAAIATSGPRAQTS